EQARLPLDVRAIHTTDLDGCGEDPASAPVQEFLRALGTMIAHTQAAQPTRQADAPASPSLDKEAARWTIIVQRAASLSSDGDAGASACLVGCAACVCAIMVPSARR